MLSLLSLFWSVTAAPPVERVAVYEVQVSDVRDRVGPVLTASIVSELCKLQGLSVIGIDEVRAMLDHEAEKQLVGCADDSCLAAIAAALGVDTIVVGSAARVGDQHVCGLRRIAQHEAKVVAQVQQRLEMDNGEEFLGVVGPAVEALFPERSLKPGATRGVAPDLAVRLNPPPLDPWAFWTGVGVTTGAIGAASVITVLWRGAEDELTAQVVDGKADGRRLGGDRRPRGGDRSDCRLRRLARLPRRRAARPSGMTVRDSLAAPRVRRAARRGKCG
jgi:hypothetical protein